MTVEPFLSRVYVFVIFPCASVVSYALPPTPIRSYAYQTFISPVSTSIRSYKYQTFGFPLLTMFDYRMFVTAVNIHTFV